MTNFDLLNEIWLLVGSDTIKNLMQLGILSLLGFAVRHACSLVKEFRGAIAEGRQAVQIMKRLTEELAYANGRTMSGRPAFEPLDETPDAGRLGGRRHMPRRPH